MENKGSSRSIREFSKLLENCPDHVNFVQQYLEFFNRTLRLNSSNADYVPFKEFISVLQVERPTIYYLLKKRSKENIFLEMLVHLEMDYELAKKNINM
jgi:hypothetical protein